MEDRTGGGQKDTRVGVDVDIAGRSVAGDRRNNPVNSVAARAENTGGRGQDGSRAGSGIAGILRLFAAVSDKEGGHYREDISWLDPI